MLLATEQFIAVAKPFIEQNFISFNSIETTEHNRHFLIITKGTILNALTRLLIKTRLLKIEHVLNQVEVSHT